jgi:hypothetical protein
MKLQQAPGLSYSLLRNKIFAVHERREKYLVEAFSTDTLTAIPVRHGHASNTPPKKVNVQYNIVLYCNTNADQCLS